jgi:hypothetical protein
MILPHRVEFICNFDFPLFMILIIALLNDRANVTLSVDRVLPSNMLDSWDLAKIFSYAVAYRLFLTLSTCVSFFCSCLHLLTWLQHELHVMNRPGSTARHVLMDTDTS